MKRLIIIILVVIVLAGLAAGASIYLHVGPLANVMQPKTPPAPPPPPPPPAHQMVVVGSFSVPVIQDHGISRSVGIDIGLDVLVADQPKVEAVLPLITNAFTLSLFEIVPGHSDAHSDADKKAIHDRLMLVADRIVGKGLVQDVVIRSIYDR
jgi:hypothetical protein